MTQKNIFQIAVRIVGLVVFLYGLEALYEGVLYAVAPPVESDVRVAKLYVMRGGLEILLGLFFVRGAAPLVSFAFTSEAQQPGNNPRDSNDAA